MSSMGMVLSPRSDPRDLEIERLRRELEQMRTALESANVEISQGRMLQSSQAEAVQNIRSILEPLFGGLKRVFGEMERGGFETFSAPISTRTSAIWEDWKAKFPGYGAKAIDALLLHGSMTQTQLRIAIGTRSAGTITNVVSSLNKAGIITKNGGKISLKEL